MTPLIFGVEKGFNSKRDGKRNVTPLIFGPEQNLGPKRLLLTILVSSQAVKLEAIEGDVQSQAVKLDGINQGVLNVIPDYQNELRHLLKSLAHQTALCDRVETQKGRLTMEINKLRWELGEKSEENESLRKDKHAQSKKIQELQEQVDLCQSIALLKQMQEEAQRTAEILSSTLADERAAKRPRA